jgi:excisionase family DNA binding protein
MSYKQASSYSGCSRTWLWREISSGELKAFRAGRSVKIHKDDLDEFLRRQSAAASGTE